MKEYSRYMKSIGEKEAPISQKSFNFYGKDVSLERLDESAFTNLQSIGITDSILEDVVRITLHHLWKNEYINVQDIEVVDLGYDSVTETYHMECLGNTKMCCVSYDRIHIISENIDVANCHSKPSIKFQEHKEKTTVIEDKVVSLDSFSKFYESIGEDNV
jgi:hypothetical protein